MLLDNIEVPRLGSLKDIAMRTVLSKRKATEVSRLMTEASASVGNTDSTNKHAKQFMSRLMYQDFEGDTHQRLLDEYKEVSKMKLSMVKTENGLDLKGL